MRLSRTVAVLGLAFLAGCSRCAAPRLRGAAPPAPTGPGKAWAVRDAFVRPPNAQPGQPVDVTWPTVAWGDPVEVLGVDGEAAAVRIGGLVGRLDRSALVEAEGVREMTWWCDRVEVPAGRWSMTQEVMDANNDPRGCRTVVLAYQRDGDWLRVLQPEDEAGRGRYPLWQARFDDEALAVARERSRVETRRRVQALVERTLRERATLEAKEPPAIAAPPVAPVPPVPAGGEEEATTEGGPALDGAVPADDVSPEARRLAAPPEDGGGDARGEP